MTMRSTASTSSCFERITLAPTPMLLVMALLLVTTSNVGAYANVAGHGLVAGNDPGFGGADAQLVLHVAENRGMRGRVAAPIVHMLPDAGQDAGDGIEMRSDALVPDVRVEERPGQQIADNVRDVLKTVRRVTLLPPDAADSDQNHFLRQARAARRTGRRHPPGDSECGQLKKRSAADSRHSNPR